MVVTSSPPPLSQNDQASQCKSTNKIPDAQQTLASCLNSEEIQRIQNFISNTTDPNGDFATLNAVYNDLLSSGDAIFGQLPEQTILDQVKTRNIELLAKKDSIRKTLESNDSKIERADRDFIDTKEALPQTFTQKTVHVLDDYTLVVLSVSYVFFLLTMMYLYMYTNQYSMSSIIQGVLIVFFGIVLGLIVSINFF
jgi:CRISPR/Cas system-associated endonuclease/helicase Cas3